jgi:ATPase family associated with various cellular activities (AAA)
MSSVDVVSNMNVMNVLREHLRTGSIVIDMLIGVILTNVFMMLFNVNFFSKLSQWYKTRMTNYAFTTLITYTPKEENSVIREQCRSAYFFFYEYLCYVFIKSEKATAFSDSMLMIRSTEHDDSTIIRKNNVRNTMKLLLPLSEIEYNGMSFLFENTKLQKSQKNNGGREEEDRYGGGGGDHQGTVYSIRIRHHTIQQINDLYDSMIAYMMEKYGEDVSLVNFQYQTGGKISSRYGGGDDDDDSGSSGTYEYYSSIVQNIPFESITLSKSTKDKFRKVLEDFSERKGYYEKNAGNPYRLVFLLYGIPGSGKTATIKMLIRRFGITTVRVIPSISTFTSDSQLRRTFFNYQNESFKSCEREKLKMIVFEELDAGDKSHILRDRRIKNEEKKSQEEVLAEMLAEKLHDDILDDCPKPGGRQIGVMSKLPKSDLTLASWLDVFDGLMSMENQIVILTTNDINYLDPAIYRKRRVTMVLEYKLVCDETFMEFIAQKFPGYDINDKKLAQVREMISDTNGKLNHSGLFDAFYMCDQNFDTFLKILIDEHAK